MTRTAAEWGGLLLFVVLLVAGGWVVHFFWLDVQYWPVIGRFFREDGPAYAPVLPGSTGICPECLCTPDTFCDDPCSCHDGHDHSVTGEVMSTEEWESLDPDTQAVRLISEWHAPDLERAADTDSMTAISLDDPDLLLWDCRRQVAKIRQARQEYRAAIAELMAPVRAELEARGAA